MPRKKMVVVIAAVYLLVLIGSMKGDALDAGIVGDAATVFRGCAAFKLPSSVDMVHIVQSGAFELQ